MKQKKKTLFAITLMLLCFVLMRPVQTDAAVIKNCKKVKFDLTEGRSKKIKSRISSLNAYANGTVQLKNIKTKNYKKGYKKITVTIAYEFDEYRLNENQVHAIANEYGRDGKWSFGMTYALVDAKTGRSYHNQNGVKLREKSKIIKKVKYTDAHGCWADYPIKGEETLTIIAPKGLKSMCLVLSGLCFDKYVDSTENYFRDDYISYNKSKYYTKSPKGTLHGYQFKNI